MMKGLWRFRPLCAGQWTVRSQGSFRRISKSILDGASCRYNPGRQDGGASGVGTHEGKTVWMTVAGKAAGGTTEMIFPKLGSVARVALAVGVAMCLTLPAQAEPGMKKGVSLRDAVEQVLKTDSGLKAAETGVQAAKENVAVELGAWYPDLDITAHNGYEKIAKGAGGADTGLNTRLFETTITQQLWDFGQSNAAIRKAKMAFEQAIEQRRAIRQALILEAITAHLEIVKAAKVLDFARGSEENVKRQTEMEDALVEKGSGFSTDVLQAKTQLAEAQSRRVVAEGSLRNAVNNYRKVYGSVPEDLEALRAPRVPFELLPDGMEDAVTIALNDHPQLRSTLLDSKMAGQDVKISNASNFWPSIDGIIENNFGEDDGGTVGTKQEHLVKIELSYDFNLGGTAFNSLRAAELARDGSVHRYADLRDEIATLVRNSWDGLLTAKENAENFRIKAAIAAEFLSLARKERQLGQRSLIDVLAGETALISANSDAAGAEMDVAKSVFSLLSAMGMLEADVFDGVK